ncbi:hypothetical protein AAHE18_08G207100 [Arachis hypogaea]
MLFFVCRWLSALQSILIFWEVQPRTIIQAAVPRILNQTEESFFKKAIDNLRLNSDICFKEIEEISCMFFPRKPEGP